MRVSILIAGVSLGLTGVSLAHPQDSPGTIYIDGVACNLSCQSYMAWSRQTLKANQTAAKGAAKVSATKTAREIDRKRISKRVDPASADTPSLKKTRDQVAVTAVPEPPLPKPRAETVPPNVETREQPVAPVTAPESSPLPRSKAESSKAESAESRTPPKQRSTQELVMAALAVAELMSSVEPSKPTDADRSNDVKAGDANPSSSRNVSLVAILISRPDVKSAAGLVGLNVAIDAAESEVQDDIRSALATAGATGVQLSVSDASPIDRMIRSDVEAAVVKLVSPEAAEAFPDIKGFKVLRVPIGPR